MNPQAMSALWPMTTPGHAGEGEARDVERAVVGDGAAVQAHLHPDPGQRDAEVRVVGEQRLAGRGVLAVDHPGVAADAVAAAEQGGHPRRARPRRSAQRPRACGGTPAAAGGGSPRRFASCSKTPSTTAPWRDDRRVLVVGVRAGRAARPARACGRPAPAPGRSRRSCCRAGPTPSP